MLKILENMQGRYTHMSLLRLVQSLLGYRRDTAIEYIEDMKRIGLLRVGGSNILLRDDEVYEKLKKKAP